MPSPGRHQPGTPFGRWGRAALGVLVIAVVAIAWMEFAPNTSLEAGGPPEGNGEKAAEPVSNAQENATADSVAQPAILQSPTMTSSVASVQFAGASRDDLAIHPIPAVDLTPEALMRYLQERRSYEVRDDYPITSTPSGQPADVPSSPAIASPAK